MYENSIISLKYPELTFGSVFNARRATRMAFAPRSRDSYDSTISKQALTKPIADAMDRLSPPEVNPITWEQTRSFLLVLLRIISIGSNKIRGIYHQLPVLY